MRHGKKFNHLGRQSAHRKSMLANMACSLIEHKRINTTTAKALNIEPVSTYNKPISEAKSFAIDDLPLPLGPTIATTSTVSTSGLTFTSTNNNSAGTATIDTFKVSHTPLGGSTSITSKTPTNTAPNATAQNVSLSTPDGIFGNS